MKNSLLYSDVLRNTGPDAFHVMIKPVGSTCNLNCTYCYYLEKKKLYPNRNEFRMSDELLEEFTKQYIEANSTQAVTFTWQGGEPTLMGLDFYIKRSERPDQNCRSKASGYQV